MNITKLQVNTVTKNIVISASESSDSYKFSHIDIDTQDTFNCKNAESTSAVNIQIKNIEENTDLKDYKIPFDSIYNSQDPVNDIFFIWIYADIYKDYVGYKSEDDFIVFTDGTNYYKTTSFENSILLSNETEYKNAKTYSESIPILKSYNSGLKIKIKYKDTEEYKYYSIDTTDLSVALEIDEEEFEEGRTKSEQSLIPSFGVTLSVKDFYELLLNHIDIVAQDNCSCDTDCSDVNFMLAWQGFNLAKTLQDYNQMINYWRILHKYNTSTSAGCTCNK